MTPTRGDEPPPSRDIDETGQPSPVPFPIPTLTLESEYASVPTSSTQAAVAVLTEHLADRRIIGGAPGMGEVVNVIGADGTGKTHLAWLLVQYCRDYARTNRQPVRPVQLHGKRGLSGAGFSPPSSSTRSVSFTHPKI